MKFLEKDNNFRPIVLQHDRFGYKYFMPYKLCVKRAKSTILKIKELGYGGIAMNVYYGKHGCKYLKSKKMFKVLAEMVDFCKEQDLKVWIYDECGYPSGSAYGQVVKKYPNAEAFGIACLDFELKANQTITVKLPYNHIAFKSATFISKSGTLDISTLAKENGSLTYTANEDGKLYYFATKTLFEGVHAMHKFSPATRYIDVLDKNAVECFVEITYERYKEYLGQYFGNVIEAFFTDEPSVMSFYMPNLPGKRYAKDKPNKKMPLYRHVVWSRNFENEFKNRKGYNILPYLYMLFDGSDEQAYKIRTDYYEVCGELYKSAYFETLSSWCEENNLKLTGHLLGEENLIEQVFNEYDNFKMLKPMQYPGIDVLTCNSKTLLEEPLLLKTSSSEAFFHEKKMVMSETGFHLDNLAKIKPNKDRILASILLQYAKGINVISSYLGIESLALEEYKYIFDRTSKAGQILNGGSFKVPLLVYYPAKSCYKFATPSEKNREIRSYDENLKLIDASIKKALINFDNNLLDYWLIDNESLMALEIKNNTASIKNRGEFGAIYFSACDFEVESITEKIINLANDGLRIYLEESPFISNELKQNKNIFIVKTAEMATSDIYNQNLNDVAVKNSKTGLAFCHKQIDNKQVYLFINTLSQELLNSVTLKENNLPSDIYNINENKQVDFKLTKGTNNIDIELKLKPYEAVFVVFK